MAKKIASLYAEIGADTTKLKSGLDETKGQLTQAKAKFDDLKASVLPAAGIVTGFGLAIKKAYDTAKEGAAMEFAIGKFDRLAESAGTTADVLLNDLKKATRGTVSDMQLMASAGDFMALGLAKSRDEIVRLTRVAGALGMDMNQLVLTLTNQTTMRFDALGVSVDGFDEKVEALKKTGMDANAAFKEAFLQQAEAQIEKVGDKADTAAGQIAMFEANVANLEDSMKRRLVPAANNVVTALNKIWFGGKEVESAFDEHAKTMTGVAKTYTEYRTEMIRAADAAGKWDIDMTTAQLYGMGAAEEEAWAKLGLLNEEQFVAENRALVFAEAVAEGRIQVQTYAETIDSVGIPATRNFYESIVKLDDINPQFGNKIKSALDDLKFQLAGGLPLQKVTDDIIAAFDAGKITPEQAQGMLGEVFVAEQALQVDMDKITADEAAKNVSDTLGVSLEDAKKLIADMDAGLRNLPRNIDVQLNFIETGDRSPGRQSDVPQEFIDDWELDNGTTATAKAAGGPVYPGMTISDWRTTSGANEVLIQQPGYVLTEQEAMDALAGARGGGGINITVYGAADPNQTANLVNMNLKAAMALNGA